MFAFFENLLPPIGDPVRSPPPDRLLGFYWYYARQVPGLIASLVAIGLAVALLDISIPYFIGRVVSLADGNAPGVLLREHWRFLALMALVLAALRPATQFSQGLVTNQAIAPGLSNLVRWQSHWHVVRQSWSFFQNDFAGRIANRVVQTGPSLRETIVSSTNSVWHIVIYGISALLLLAHTDWRLAVPLVVWFCAFFSMLRFFVPRMRDRSRRASEARSALTGRIVDSYTNILTVKLFARAADEDAFVREALLDQTALFRHQTRLNTLFVLSLNLLNGCLIVAMGADALLQWSAGRIPVGMIATALPLAWQVASLSGWVSQNVTSIFESVGMVQDGMNSIAVPRQEPDPPDAGTLEVGPGAIRFERVGFGYGGARGVLHKLDLCVQGGERVGLIGTSGAGKSTLVNLLLRLHQVEQGRILIDGQDIAQVTQESLRHHIAMVTQDTSLLHRSIRDNIRFGRPAATEAQIRRAAEQAHALEFIEQLVDNRGRRGFAAEVGERGVKLSGGQRQRIAIARVILKDAPILILDEATSALDSEVEAAIQEQLASLMEGRTVIAIAHRLSTIARMDRLVVLDRGRIVEQGTHAALLAAGGAYARLWARQSGGFEEVRMV